MGIFGGSGVGKSTLIGMMTRETSADLTVLGLVGERGREVREFLEDTLGVEGMARSVVVVSTSDQPPLSRIRAALAATTVAEYFAPRKASKSFWLWIRSPVSPWHNGKSGSRPESHRRQKAIRLRYSRSWPNCRAGRPFWRRGNYRLLHPSLWKATINWIRWWTRLRAILDGHIVLDRKLSAQGHYPPISILDSLSRLMPAVCASEHLAKAQRLRSLLASYAASEDLVRVGAYQKERRSYVGPGSRRAPRDQCLPEAEEKRKRFPRTDCEDFAGAAGIGCHGISLHTESGASRARKPGKG